jgi:hypothetical protein
MCSTKKYRGSSQKQILRNKSKLFKIEPITNFGCDNFPFLKVLLTNEKRGGLSVVSFDRSRFKLYSRKFSNKLVQAPSYDRHKTDPRTLFLLFESYNWFPITQ